MLPLALAAFLLLLGLHPALHGQSTCLPQRVTRNGKLYVQYTYEDNQLVQMITYDENGAPTDNQQFKYTAGSKQIASITGISAVRGPYKRTFERDKNGCVTQMNIFASTAGGYQLVRYHVYKNKMKKGVCQLQATAYYHGDGTLFEQYTVEYTDENGSSMSKRVDAAGNPIATEIWKRDGKKSMRIQSPFPYQESHNLIAQKRILSDGTTDPGSWSMDLIYNKEGYPVKIDQIFKNGLEHSIEVEYRCK